MNLAPKQRAILLLLTTEWQTPRQIAAQLPKETGDLSSVNQLIKELIGEGLVQTNPIQFGLYRLTSQGVDIKKELARNQ